MIQAIGLTSNARKELPPAVDDVSFEAPAGRVTALLGAPGAGKTTALRLMLELEPGRGITYFRGRPLHRVPHPSREVGVLLGEVPGHPARTVRGQLRMLCAAAGVPASRADDVLEVVGLAGLRDERLGTLSRGMDRRLGLACALLPDPHALVLDGAADGLSAREGRWLHGVLRAHAGAGGAVLFATDDPKEAASAADRVVTLERGRVVADQEAAEFSRTRLRPRVAVRSPHAARLGALLTQEARSARHSVEVVREDGNRLCVYGSTCADIGETAYRHGILVHQLADEVGDMGPVPVPEPEKGPGEAATPSAQAAQEQGTRASSPLPPPLAVRPGVGPLRPLRYELRRAAGIGTGWTTAAVVLVASAVVSVLLARAGHTPQSRLLAAWPRDFPLPPAALGAGLLGAFAFGDEFRHPALAVDRGTVPRRLGLLAAKLVVAALTALTLAVVVVGVDAELLHLLYGRELTGVPPDWIELGASWIGLVVGCAWAGVLAAGVFRSTTAGLAAVLAVPIAVVPVVQKVLEGPSVRTAAGFSTRLRELVLVRWPFGGEHYLAAAAGVIAQPVAGALMLSLTALLCAYLLTSLRSRVR
ncbi:ABC-type multidrug transport system ATPase subunit [Streptomyces sp. V3I8]|uniref:ABC transporter ATP-binding protein n=1 Tax=Streptomyces sp. V3I8 TaxID=3042279 RepID=UPI00278A1E9D|nr:ABC transporter ATP-binding protein [Streptomyces sp. V3I8]MDQ1035744.1 ABC-type multidrug transport system ATPase subunit [Streptomyces sp. V3I8]